MFFLKKYLFPVVAILLLLLANYTGLSQFSYSVHYSVNDGLPSSKVYDMLLDSNGYLWFATENGVSRYDGYTFHNYTTDDGLPANSTLKLYEDFKGRIWFLSYQGKIAVFENNEIKSSWLNEKLKDLSVTFFSSIYVDKNDALWLSKFYSGLIRIDSSGNIEQIGEKKSKNDSVLFYYNRKDYGDVSGYFDDYGDSAKSFFDSRELILKLPILPTEHHFGSLRYFDDLLIYLGNNIYRIRNKHIEQVYHFENEIVGVFSDKKNNIWVAEKFHGATAYTDAKFDNPLHHFLPGYTISKVIQDNEGSYWFSSAENGVHYVPSLNMSLFNKSTLDLKSDIVLAMQILNNKMIFSTDGKELYVGELSNGDILNLKCLDMSNEFVDNIYALYFHSDYEIYVAGDVYKKVYDVLTSFDRGKYKIQSTEYGYAIERLYNDQLAVIYTRGIKLLKDNEIVYNTGDHDFKIRTFAMEQLPDSSIWLGTMEGLYLYHQGNIEKKLTGNTILDGRISAIEFHNQNLLVGSFDNGLALVGSDSVYSLDDRSGLTSNRIKSIFVDHDSVFWVGTNNGLNKVSIVSSDPYHFKVNTLDIWDGLPSNEINAIGKNGDYLWLATSKGLVSFKPEEIDFFIHPPFFELSEIILNSMDTVTIADLAELKNFENDITFRFNGLSYKDPGNISYFYMLEGLNNKWQETKNTSVRFHSLAPGEYIFKIKAQNRDKIFSNLVSIPVIVSKPFTKTTFFYLILAFSVILIVLLIYYLSYKAQKRKASLQRQVILAEQKAFLSQMNPHFIFNSLNSIQNFILERDDKSANNYLVVFSSLIRKILEISQKNFITLKEEIETVKLYLELEKFRFEDKFDYSIRIDKQINPANITIPSLILQPYLENAIWHGIMSKGTKGTIELEVDTKDHNKMEIRITDDGIGREKAFEISKRRTNHKPTGMKNVNERLNLLNQLNNTNMSVDLIDLYDEMGNSCGTKVVFDLDVYLDVNAEYQ